MAEIRGEWIQDKVPGVEESFGIETYTVKAKSQTVKIPTRANTNYELQVYCMDTSLPPEISTTTDPALVFKSKTNNGKVMTFKISFTNTLSDVELRTALSPVLCKIAEFLLLPYHRVQDQWGGWCNHEVVIDETVIEDEVVEEDPVVEDDVEDGETDVEGDDVTDGEATEEPEADSETTIEEDTTADAADRARRLEDPPVVEDDEISTPAVVNDVSIYV